YSFMLECDGKRVYITGDLHSSMKDIPDILKTEHTDLFVTECAHFGACELYEKIREINTSKAAVVHVMPPQKYEALKENIFMLPFETVFPEDGDTAVL
nr:hypothetical protein [Clostridia bacterium]